MRRSRSGHLAAAAAPVSSSPGAATHLTAARVPGAGAWQGPQFVQADATGGGGSTVELLDEAGVSGNVTLVAALPRGDQRNSAGDWKAQLRPKLVKAESAEREDRIVAGQVEVVPFCEKKAPVHACESGRRHSPVTDHRAQHNFVNGARVHIFQ